MSKEKGNQAEDKAVSFLEDRGFKVVQKNFYAKKLGEIDIVCKKDDIYHFCEVKSALAYEVAVNNLTFSKLSKIKRSVEYYLQKHKIAPAYCIDVIIVCEDEIELLENVTV